MLYSQKYDDVQDRSVNMTNINTSIFKKNTHSLFPYKEQLAIALRTAKIPYNISLFQTISKHLTAEVNIASDSTKLLHSAVDPLEEAKCWAQMQNINTEDFVLLGLGMGYPALAIIDQGFRGKLYLVEKDIGIFKLATMHCDLTKMFIRDKVDLFIGADTDNLMDSFRKNKTTSLSYKIYQPAASLHPQFYNDVSLKLDKIIFEINRNNNPQCFKAIEVLLRAINE
jgi:hypothetical protein